MVRSPPRTLALQLLKREKVRGLPIDVEGIADKHSTVEYRDVPFSFDGITIKTKGLPARIIVNRTQSTERRRFTLAHELGHLIIPWHAGIILDADVDEVDIGGDPEYREMESEANAFAAELLLPSSQLESKIIGVDSATDVATFVQQIASDAIMSLTASVFQIFGNLPPGYIFLVVDQNTNTTIFSGKSTGTIVNVPQQGEQVDTRSLYQGISYQSQIHASSRRFIFYRIHGTQSAEYSSDKEWRPILKQIVRDQFSTRAERDRNYKTVNSILGALFGMHAKGKITTFDELYSLVIIRLHGYRGLEWLVNNPKFEQFATRKASDLFDRLQ